MGHLSKSEPPQFRQRHVFRYNPLSNAVLRLIKIHVSVQIYLVTISHEKILSNPFIKRIEGIFSYLTIIDNGAKKIKKDRVGGGQYGGQIVLHKKGDVRIFATAVFFVLSLHS